MYTAKRFLLARSQFSVCLSAVREIASFYDRSGKEVLIILYSYFV